MISRFWRQYRRRSHRRRRPTIDRSTLKVGKKKRKFLCLPQNGTEYKSTCVKKKQRRVMFDDYDDDDDEGQFLKVPNQKQKIF